MTRKRQHGIVFSRLTTAALLATTLALLQPAPLPAGQACAGTWWITPTELSVGQPLPEFGFATCDGEELTTTELAGKPLLLNFWATWCPPCVRELPHFEELHEEHGEDVYVLGVSVDKQPDAVRSFLKRKPLPYLLAWDSDGVARDLGFATIPATIAVDAEGKVVRVHRGYADPEDMADLLAAARGEAQTPAGSDGLEIEAGE